MNTAAQKAFFTSLAAFARSTANLLDEMSKNDDAPTEAPAKPAKPAKAAAGAADPTPTAVAPKPAASVAAAPAAAPVGGDLMAEARKKAKEYAEVYGREGLKEMLSKFTTGTLAEVPADKLPDLIKALS